VRLALLHARFDTLELARFPTFAVPTLLFPAVAFVFFVVPDAGAADANLLMASYMAFGFLAVAFFEFGVGIAADRTSPWDRFLRTLPVSVSVRLAGRILTALLFATAPALIVLALGLALTPVSLSAGQWGALAAALLAGSIPFGLLGIAIGYVVSPKGALPVANLLFLALAYLGGLFTGPAGLPDAVGRFSVVLPTRQWSSILDAAVADGPVQVGLWLGLAGWTVAGGALAAWAYRRDEGLRYR
jgi:ABC-2 type transport system permease protein